jgi:hypothetical protein
VDPVDLDSDPDPQHSFHNIKFKYV